MTPNKGVHNIRIVKKGGPSTKSERGRTSKNISKESKLPITVEDSYCALCPSVEETADHIFFECALAHRTWECLGVDLAGGSCRHPWLMGRELPLPPSVQYDVVLLIFWQLWKARNAVIFDQEQRSVRRVLRHVVDDMENWRSRYKQHQEHWLAWNSYFSTFL
ncbi:hypothetical protein HU200_015446 [Digitaria exilis]|uniref:Reverse transcriptase zinc-binding domain-containing protein n=1 Tax=Digitaria exilis TaxID=1010633 RepID=A0A835FAS1_9POAL|nr:hypothetical protein HU200_015446 [Digitaria exilis]